MNRDGHRLIGVDQPLDAQVQVLWAIIDQNAILGKVLDAVARIMPPHWYLGAGCIAQTVWNYTSGRDLLDGVKDLDLVYFDATDLSEEAETAYEERICEQVAGTAIRIDVKNEARVHLWYEKRFGYPIEPYSSLEDAINTWPTTATSIGIRRSGAVTAVYAPFGLNDLFGMVVRPNKSRSPARSMRQKPRVGLRPGRACR